CASTFWTSRDRPSSMLRRSFGSTVEGRLSAASWACWRAVVARAQFFRAVAEATSSTLDLSLLASERGIRLLRSPQATSSALESPSAAARRVTTTGRIRGRMLLAVLQPLGQRLGQVRGPDRGGRGGDVVLRAQVGGPPGVGVEHHPGGARIAVARLPDA